MSMETNEGTIETPLCINCKEIYAVVLKHVPSYDWQQDAIEVLIEDQIYSVYRTESCISETPYFNVRTIRNE